MKIYVWSTKRQDENGKVLWHYVISVTRTRGVKPTKVVSLETEDRRAVGGYFDEHHEYCPCFDTRRVPDEVKRLYGLILGTDALVEGRDMQDEVV